jgi:UDP-N-acetyl-2-amino-2-deoxyglucuronate dehydrogenase
VSASGGVGVAIVGCGVVGALHAQALALVPRARLRLAVDPAVGRARALATPRGADATDDLDAALERPDVDVVCVCVPSGRHADIGVKAARAGKHVIVEKPIDVTLAAADRLITACDSAGVVLSVMSQHRFDAGVVRLREALEAGALGRPILGDAAVKWYRTQDYYDSAAWRGTWQLDGGGALMNQGIHSVDLLRWLLGPVDTVSARTATAAHSIEVEDVVVATVAFASGALGTVVATTAAYPGLPERLEVTGTRGTVVLEAGNVIAWSVEGDGAAPAGARFPAAGPTGATDPAAIAVQAHAAQLDDVITAVVERRAPAVTGRQGREALAVVLAIYASATTGRQVAMTGPPWR